MRRISRGFLGSATGVPIRAFSIGPFYALGVCRTKVPGRWNHLLVILDLALLDVDPMAQ